MIKGKLREEWPAEVEDGQKLHARHLFQVAHWAALGMEGVFRAGVIPWGFFRESSTAPELGCGANVFESDGDRLRISELAFLTTDGHVVRWETGVLDVKDHGSTANVELVWAGDEMSKNYSWRMETTGTSPLPGGSRCTGEKRLRILTLQGHDGAVEYHAPFVHAGAVRDSRDRLDDIDKALGEMREKLEVLANGESSGVTGNLPFGRLNHASHALRAPRSYFLAPLQLAERLEELGESVERFVNQLDWARHPTASALPTGQEGQRFTLRPGADLLPEWRSDDPFLGSGRAVIVALHNMWTMLSEANRRILLSEELIGEADKEFGKTVNWSVLRYEIDTTKKDDDRVKKVRIEQTGGGQCKICLGQIREQVLSGESIDLKGAHIFWLEFRTTERPPRVFVVRDSAKALRATRMPAPTVPVAKNLVAKSQLKIGAQKNDAKAPRKKPSLAMATKKEKSSKKRAPRPESLPQQKKSSSR